jgi:hypothetical protein
VSDDPLTTHVDVSEANLSTDDDNDVAYVEHNLDDGDVESHHELYWKRDGLLEQPLNKMLKMCDPLKPEYVKNFGTPLDSIMSVFPWIYWKILYHDSNSNAIIKIDQQFFKIGKRIISGSK